MEPSTASIWWPILKTSTGQHLLGETLHVYATVDGEAKRYLDFEKCGRLFLMTDKEIPHHRWNGLSWATPSERGEFELEEGKTVDLKNNSNPVVVFASFGDNITPRSRPSTGVNVYGTWKEIPAGDR